MVCISYICFINKIGIYQSITMSNILQILHMFLFDIGNLPVLVIMDLLGIPLLESKSLVTYDIIYSNSPFLQMRNMTFRDVH